MAAHPLQLCGVRARYMHRSRTMAETGATRKILLALTVATGLGLLALSAYAQQSIGVVKRSKGEVRVERAGSQLPVVKGSALHRGDRLLTGRDGYAYIDIHGTAPIAVGPEMDVSLDRFVRDGNRVTTRSPPRLLQGLASFFALNRHR
jgi:hypothetical protein